MQDRKFVILVLTAALLLTGMGGPAPKAPSVESKGAKSSAPAIAVPDTILVDDFEDGNYTENPEWWTFGNLKVSVVPTGELRGGDEETQKATQKFALNLRGPSTDWYVGGIGTYLAREHQDLSLYSRVEMDVYGIGPNTGTLKLELIDDDNGNWQTEYDEKWVPKFDDRWVFELSVDWKGWKHVPILFTEFRVDNPGRGDGIWNPEQMDGSGGLLQLQCIAITRGQKGTFNATVDNVRITRAVAP